MKIYSGTSNPALSKAIVDYLGTSLGECEVVNFPDGETFVRIADSVRGRDVFVIQSICGRPNETLMELLIMIDALRRASAGRITAVLPIYGYARQDRKDQPRVPITAKLVANLLVAAGANRLLTMDLHADPVITDYLTAKRFKDPVVVSPDTGSVKKAYSYSQRFGCGLAIVAKQRKSGSEVEAYSLVGDVEGKDVIMIDDLTSTCGTLCAAANLCAKFGAASVHAAVTHSLLDDTGLARLRESAITELIVTDTVPQRAYKPEDKVVTLSVAKLFGEAIRRIHNNESVNSLFI